MRKLRQGDIKDAEPGLCLRASDSVSAALLFPSALPLFTPSSPLSVPTVLPLAELSHSKADLSSFCFLAQRACVLSHFSHVRLSETVWTTACQAALSMGFSRQEYCSGLPCLPPWDLPNPGIEPTSLMSSALVGGFFTIVPSGKLKGGGGVIRKQLVDP